MAMAAGVRAPEINLPGLHWFNVQAPLGLDDLRGRLVILDFWTFCCINCIQILPILHLVEEAYPEDVVVIGVHSPKFPAERDPDNVARAIARYGIRHPVVHDPDFRIWRQYAVRAWPTLMFVSPDGHVIGQNAGEPDEELLMKAIEEVLEGYRQNGQLQPRALQLTPVTAEAARFSFPGKIKPLPDPGPKQWILADAGHHQVVVLDDDGQDIRRYGRGVAGFEDGTANEAAFNGPQGLIADQAAIYVADTGNHAIRRIDRATGAVTTLAGTGERGGILDTPAVGAKTALASPWDLEWRNGMLPFANAGTHQIGLLDPLTGLVSKLAGGGPEGLRDGRAGEAHLAQPSGLVLSADGGTLYFADSETSSIRALNFATDHVTTLVGEGLFEFGHENGPFEQARLQHALGVALAADGSLLVADSYNAEIRVLDLANRTVRDFDAGRFQCSDPVCLPLGEPAGIFADGPDRILLSDTNNHRILEYRVSDGVYRTWAGSSV
jgi:thiol-disulfide isomerase/thioredoxin